MRGVWLLELPGVYERYVSNGSTSLLITVLRYRCEQTGATVSLLPDFAQPYRLLASELIEDYFLQRANGFLDSWFDLLKSYLKKVTRTLTKRLKVSTFGRYQCHLNCHEKRRLGQEPLGKN